MSEQMSQPSVAAPTSTTQTAETSQLGRDNSGSATGGASQPFKKSQLGRDNIPHKEPAPQDTSLNELFEVKVNGKIQKMTKQEVLDHASMAYVANSKFEEAAKIRKQVEKIVSTAKKNPIEALMDPALGLTKDQIREAFETWYTKEFIEPETLTPEQKRIKEVEAKLSRYEQEELEKKQREEFERTEKMTAQQREYLQGQIIDAMEKSGLPKTKFFASRMAFYMRENLLKGWEAPLDLIVSQVKKERKEMMADFTENSTAEQLIALLGEDVINKIRQHDLQQLRARRQIGAPQFSTATPSTPPTDKISSSEVTRRLREMRMGKR